MDDVISEAHRKGYTLENLPALRQYSAVRESGNMRAAERIKENLREFLKQEN